MVSAVLVLLCLLPVWLGVALLMVCSLALVC